VDAAAPQRYARALGKLHPLMLLLRVLNIARLMGKEKPHKQPAKLGTLCTQLPQQLPVQTHRWKSRSTIATNRSSNCTVLLSASLTRCSM
jgi:hypothetical protein